MKKSGITAIVIDDEQPSREVLQNYINEYCNDIEVVALCNSANSAYNQITAHKPDLLFLDIEMPGGSGFDLLKMFDNIEFKVIFITAYSEYAIKAFRYNAIDYLLKPIKVDELQEAVLKVRKELEDGRDSMNIKELMKSISLGAVMPPTLIIPNIKGFDVVKIQEIILCKADGGYTEFYLTGKRKLTSSKNLKYYENTLVYHNFHRVHHSFLVNLSHIIKCTKLGEIFLIENNLAYLGESYRKAFLKALSMK